MLLLIPLLPFVGFLLNASVGRRLSQSRVSGGDRRRAAMRRRRSPCRVVGRRAAARRCRRSRGRSSQTRLHVDHVGRLSSAGFTLRLDPLSALMILVVTGIGSLIHIYSTAYMHEERDVGVRALLLVPESVRRVHAAPRARRELPRDVRRLGGRRPLLVPADRLLVPEEVGRRRRQEGVHRQSHRRLRVHPRRAAALRARSARSTSRRLRAAVGRLAPGGDVRHAVARSRCCCSSARPASRRRFRSTSGCRTRWKARRRSRRSSTRRRW